MVTVAKSHIAICGGILTTFVTSEHFPGFSLSKLYSELSGLTQNSVDVSEVVEWPLGDRPRDALIWTGSVCCFLLHSLL